MSVADVATLVGLLLTVLAIAVAALQLRKDAKASRGAFLLALDETFAHHEKMRKRVNDSSWDPDPDDPDDEKRIHAGKRNVLRRYMAVFERIGILVTDGSLDLALASTIYGDRFEKLVRACCGPRKAVVWILKEKPEDWLYFIELWRRLETQRRGVPELPAVIREHRLEQRPRWWMRLPLL